MPQAIKRSIINTTFALSLVVLALFAITSGAHAMIIDQRHSAFFDSGGLTQYEGDVVPSVITGNATGWSSDGDILTIINKSDPSENWFGHAGGTFTATAYTVEARFRVADAGDGNSKVGTMTISGGAGGGFHLVDFYSDRIDNPVDTSQRLAEDMTADFQTVRIAVQSDTDTTAHIYFNDVEISDSWEAISIPNLNRTLFGDDGGSINSGTLEMDYLRVDTMGAFAPGEIPEPSSLVLLGLLALAATRRRRK